MSGSKPLPPPLAGFGEGDDARRKAATEAFGEGMAGVDLERLDDALDDDAPDSGSERDSETKDETETEPRERSGPKLARPPSSEADRPNLEPIADEAHPPQNRRIPTQPPTSDAFSKLELQRDEPPAPAEQRREAKTEDAKTEDAKTEDAAPGLATPRRPANRSPSPSPVRRGLFSTDRPTNLIAGLAVGLLLTIYPAKKIAERYEAREVQPMIADLEGAIDHPLGVEAGLVEKPEAIAARIDEGRGQVRGRFWMVWLLAGLPLGLGLAFAPRPGD